MAIPPELIIGLQNRFSSTLTQAFGQSKSKLRSYADIVPIDSNYLFLDDIGTVSMRKNNDYSAPITDQNVEYGRRRLKADRYIGDIKIDKNVLEKMATGDKIMGNYVNQFMAESNRIIDAAGVLSAYASTYDENSVERTFATDGGIAYTGAEAGVTLDTFRAATLQLSAKGFGIDMNTGLIHIITEEEADDYHKEDQLSNQLYGRSSAVVYDANGEITAINGAQIIRFPTTPLNGKDAVLPVAAGIRTCLLLHTKGSGVYHNALMLGIEKNFSVEIVPLHGLHETWAIKANIKFGWVRQAKSGVVKYTTTV